MLPTIALIGRPNVGKSTLFNRLLRKSRAITHDTPGVTRDRIYGRGSADGVSFGLVDTGGMVLSPIDSTQSSHDFDSEIFDQASEALEECQAVLLVVDGRKGMNPLDKEVADLVRATGKPTLVLVNKVDGGELEAQALADFHQLGFDLLAVSAAHGYNLQELRSKVADFAVAFDDGEEEEDDGVERGLRLAMLGRPNAGKSSIVNCLLGEKRVIVSDVAGTTRDTVDVTYEIKGKRYTFIDTAGVRRRANIKETLERFSVLRALKSSKKADVTVVVLDAVEGLTRQDKRLLAFLINEKTPFMVVVNKIDLVPRSDTPKLKKGFEDALELARHVPIIYSSALKGTGLGKVLPTANSIKKECGFRIGTGELNRIWKQVLEKHHPPAVKRRRPKFFYLTQADADVPTFVCFVNDKKLIKTAYVRYLENQLRKLFRIEKAPLNLVLRSSHKNDPKYVKRSPKGT